VQCLYDCKGFLYHLALQYNEQECSCRENSLLQDVYDALDAADEGKAEQGREECMQIVIPFMLEDYRRRRKSKETPQKDHIKLQAVTKDGKLSPMSHHLELEYPPTKPVKNEYPSIRTVSHREVEGEEEISYGISKVKFAGQVYCIKSVHRKLNVICFQREIGILKECVHPNIVSLNALITDEEGDIEGMLLEYIANARVLSDVESLSQDECNRWSKEIRNGLEYLHAKGLVWGDVKSGNVLIRGDGSAVLIDFGGGFTEGWVDCRDCETVKGDWQGFERIMSFLQERLKTQC
jgi:serine/threonine protein kinase